MTYQNSTISSKKEMDFTPGHSVWEVFNLKLTSDAYLALEMAVMAIALCKFLAIKATPHIKKWANVALIAVAKSAVWALPKIILGTHLVACWVIEIALRVIKDREGAIVA